MKKIVKTSFLFFLIFSLTACVEKKVENIQELKTEKITINELDLINNFSYNFRSTWMYLKERDFNNAISSWDDLEKNWQIAKDIFVMQTGLLRAKQDAQISIVERCFRQGEDAIGVSEFMLSEEYLENIYKNWSKYCNRELCQKSYDRDVAWISVYEKIEPIMAIKSEKELETVLPPLKLEFTKAKEFGSFQDWEEWVDDFSRVIVDLENSDTKGLVECQKNLLKVFKEVFNLK